MYDNGEGIKVRKAMHNEQRSQLQFVAARERQRQTILSFCVMRKEQNRDNGDYSAMCVETSQPNKNARINNENCWRVQQTYRNNRYVCATPTRPIWDVFGVMCFFLCPVSSLESDRRCLHLFILLQLTMVPLFVWTLHCNRNEWNLSLAAISK